jgi:hypothetical protein
MPQSTKENKELKREAHYLASLIWGGLNSGFGNRAAMYSWMQINTRTGHIATLNKRELIQLIKQLRRKSKSHGNSIPKFIPKKERWWEG